MLAELGDEGWEFVFGEVGARLGEYGSEEFFLCRGERAEFLDDAAFCAYA